MEPGTRNKSGPLRAKRSTLFSGDRSIPQNGSMRQQGNRQNLPVPDHEPTPRDFSASIIKCQLCNKKFGRLFRRKKTCKRCRKATCGKCFSVCCGFNGSNAILTVQLSLCNLEAYEKCPKFWHCKLLVPNSIFRCRDRELSANLSIGDDFVINFRSQLTPSISCSCRDADSKKFFQSIKLHFDSGRKHKFSKWTSASFIMDFLAIDYTYLFVLLSGMGSTFYGVAKISIRCLQKFRRVCESLDVTCRNEDDVKVRIQGSFCWKIYNDEFNEPSRRSSSSQGSDALVSEDGRLGPTKVNQTLKELRSHYENFLFTAKNHEIKIMEENYENSRDEVHVESGGKCSGPSSSQQYMPTSKQNQILRDSKTAMKLPLGISSKSLTLDERVKRARQFIKIIDISSIKTVPGELIRLLCPICIKPILCLNSSHSMEVSKLAPVKPTVSIESSWSNLN